LDGGRVIGSELVSGDDDLRFSDTLVRHLQAARLKLVPYSVFEKAGTKKLQRFEREGRLTAGKAMAIAGRVFGIADLAGSPEVGVAANDLHVDAAALWRQDARRRRRSTPRSRSSCMSAFNGRLRTDVVKKRNDGPL
jgi:hypothetical protein